MKPTGGTTGQQPTYTHNSTQLVVQPQHLQRRQLCPTLRQFVGTMAARRRSYYDLTNVAVFLSHVRSLGSTEHCSSGNSFCNRRLADARGVCLQVWCIDEAQVHILSAAIGPCGCQSRAVPRFKRSTSNCYSHTNQSYVSSC